MSLLFYLRAPLSHPLWKLILNRSRDVRFSTQSLQMCQRNKAKECNALAFHIPSKKKWGGGARTSNLVRLLHSDSTSNSMFNSCASRKYVDKYAALRNTFCWLWRAQRSVDGWMEKHRAADGIFLSEKWELSLKLNNPSIRRYTGFNRVGIDAATIHTCSLYLELHHRWQLIFHFPLLQSAAGGEMGQTACTTLWSWSNEFLPFLLEK